jgi:peptidoglycan/LPS O-acetylase OafA/YrhL
VIYNQRFTRGRVGDLTFTQNYLTGWGYSYGASWSLAVEEHFYFGLCIVIWLIANRKNKDPLHVSNPFYRLPQWIFAIMIFCLFLRILSNYFFPGQEVRNFTMTHLRMDTILIGVLVSYFYHFHANWFRIKFDRVKSWLFLLMIPALIWTPFISPVPSYFVKTIGFTIVFLALGILLVYFVFYDKILIRLNQAMSAPVVNAISKIGVCSYPIYIIHILVIKIQADIIHSNHWVVNPLISFAIALSVSIAFGFLSTYTMERFYLQLRDKFYPSRTGLPV